MDDVPDLRGLAGRLVRRLVAMALGVASGVAAAWLMPRGARHGSELAPMFLVLGMAIVVAAAWSVVLDVGARAIARRFAAPNLPRAWISRGVAR